MTWSFSSHGMFRKCPRQWFYRKVLGHWKAKDPIRREAYRLSKLEGIQAWRGKVVDEVISESIIPSLNGGRRLKLEAAKRIAMEKFDQQRSERLAANGQPAPKFFEVEFGSPPSEGAFTHARQEVLTALDTFYGMAPLWEILQQAQARIPQAPISFSHGGVTVRVVPDLILFQPPAPPIILDWKVNARAMRDYWLQLVTGAVGVSRCTPHKGWPPHPTPIDPAQVSLFEVQLLTGDFRRHAITEKDIFDAEDFISISASDIELACGTKKRADLLADDFAVATDPRTCQYCSFRNLCWSSPS